MQETIRVLASILIRNQGERSAGRDLGISERARSAQQPFSRGSLGTSYTITRCFDTVRLTSISCVTESHRWPVDDDGAVP
jgi:hypothetical protein